MRPPSYLFHRAAQRVGSALTPVIPKPVKPTTPSPHRGIKRLLAHPQLLSSSFSPLYPRLLGHLCIKKTQGPENPTAGQPRSLPTSEKQSYSGANTLCLAVGSWPTHAPHRCPFAGPAGPVTSAPAPHRLPPGPGPLPASSPRTSPTRWLRRRSHWCRPAPEERPLAGWEVIHWAHSATRRLARKLPYYCDAENGETPSRVRGAVTVGIPSSGAAAAKVRGAGAGVPRRGRRVPLGTAVSARLLAGRLQVAARDDLGPGAWGGRGAAPAVPAGRPSASHAPPWRSRGSPSDQELPRPERPEAALKMGAPPTPTRGPAIQEASQRRQSKTGSSPSSSPAPI